jgi:hypothetical protein
MLLIKNDKIIIKHAGTPASAVRAAERMGLRYFTLLRATPIAIFQRRMTGKWTETDLRRAR